jgi:lysophospholipase L1-like esterase
LLPARPWRGYSREDLEQEFNRRWPAQCLRTAEASGRVGLAGAALEIPPDERLVLRGSFGGFRLHLLGPAGTEPVVAPPDVEPVEAAPTALLLREVLRSPLDDRLALRILEPDSTGPFPALSIGLPEGLRLLGVDLRSGRPGAVVDELGLNGAELFDLERWDPTLSAVLLAELRPSLLVLAFGTNDLGRRDLDGAAYRVHAARLLRSLKEAGGAPILLVGPLDRMGRRRRGQNLKLGAKTVIEAMRGASADAGCAFWNARAAMGGEGSIQRWRKQRLAQRDLVHLSVGGYQKLADLLMKAMDEAEAAWKKRQAEPE